MKKLLLALVGFGLVAYALFTFWPGAPKPGSLVDVIGRMLDKPDTVAFRTLERQRDSLNAALRSTDSATEAMRAAFGDSLAAAQKAQRQAEVRTAFARSRADSLTRALARVRDDDDSLPVLVQLVRAKDSVIVAVLGERDAAMGRVSILERAVEARDSALVLYRTALTETMRQRDAYRKFSGSRNLLRAGAVLVATVAVCRSLPEPC